MTDIPDNLNVDLLIGPRTKERSLYVRSILNKELLKRFYERGYTSRQISAIAVEKQIPCDPGRIIELAREYGITPPSHSQSAKNSMARREATNMERFGNRNALGRNTLPFLKRNKTVLDRYGCSNVFAADEVKDKIVAFNIKHHGVPYRLNIKCSTNFSKPHQIVDQYLTDQQIDHKNERKYLFFKYNDELGRDYSPIPDIIIEGLKVVIEINGDYYHGNPNKYKSTDELCIPRHAWAVGGKIETGKVWEFDAIRKRHIESFGYKVVNLWETDIKSGKFSLDLTQHIGTERVWKSEY
jgi:G:T-mismatch repair DNA endonuclease (very short patch repair protein)